jgi:hypothetical protein
MALTGINKATAVDNREKPFDLERESRSSCEDDIPDPKAYVLVGAKNPSSTSVRSGGLAKEKEMLGNCSHVEQRHGMVGIFLRIRGLQLEGLVSDLPTAA